MGARLFEGTTHCRPMQARNEKYSDFFIVFLGISLISHFKCEYTCTVPFLYLILVSVHHWLVLCALSHFLRASPVWRQQTLRFNILQIPIIHVSTQQRTIPF